MKPAFLPVRNQHRGGSLISNLLWSRHIRTLGPQFPWEFTWTTIEASASSVVAQHVAEAAVINRLAWEEL